LKTVLKVKWGDAYEGYGEHYWDYNHGSSSHKSYPKSYKSKATTYSESSENFNYDTPSNQPKPTVAYQEYPELSAPVYHTIGRYQKGIESIGGSSDESDPLHQVPVYKPAPVGPISYRLGSLIKFKIISIIIATIALISLSSHLLIKL